MTSQPSVSPSSYNRNAQSNGGNYCCGIVSLDAARLANVIALCYTPLWARVWCWVCVAVRGCGWFIKGLVLSCCELKPLAGDASCSQLLCQGHPSVGNWAAWHDQKLTPHQNTLRLMDVHRGNWHQYLWNERRRRGRSDELFLSVQLMKGFPWIHWRRF